MTGRRWAYAGAFLGGAVSVAANVAHSYVPPPAAPASWTPHVGAVVGAVFWPVALFVAVEIMARVPWPHGRRWTAVRYLGLLPVALVAAVVSYRHLSGLLAFYGEDSLTATVGPLAVDGLMVMATAALIATSSALRSRPHLSGRTDTEQANRFHEQEPAPERTAAAGPGLNGHHPELPAAGTEQAPNRSADMLVTSTDSPDGSDVEAPGQRTDAQVLGDHGEDLFDVLRNGGRLSRYRVEQICNVSARQADRVKVGIEDLYASTRTDRTDGGRASPS